MNTTQIKCFLAVTETLNFTKAAAQLFISQPGLSKQIVSLERELNTLLFIRDKQKVRLTPAGAMLAAELAPLQNNLTEIIEKVRTIGKGFSGTLTIGVLEGQWLGESLTNSCIGFMKRHQNIDLVFRQGSFKELREWLINGEVDIILTLRFDIADIPGLVYESIDEDEAILAISKQCAAGKKEHIEPADLAGEVFIAISPEDSRAGEELSKKTFKKLGLSFAGIKYAPNLATAMMWIEAGQGVGIINHKSSLVMNSSIRLLTEIKIDDKEASSCIAWLKNNLNPAISIFMGELA
ncbi:MAG: LysR family transcriptional regulator [Lachnospiraceae bacterium]|nr:LysR family transcriptional regulator [Lachnospiraceae bacterium]